MRNDTSRYYFRHPVVLAVLVVALLLVAVLPATRQRNPPPASCVSSPETRASTNTLVMPGKQPGPSSNRPAVIVTARTTPKVDEPIRLAATKALEQMHQMKSEIGSGINFVRYGDLMSEVGAKLDNLGRVIRDVDDDSLPPEVNDLVSNLGRARDCYYAANALWKMKMKFPEQNSSSDDEEMQNNWNKAAEHIEKSDTANDKIQKMK